MSVVVHISVGFSSAHEKVVGRVTFPFWPSLLIDEIEVDSMCRVRPRHRSALIP